MIDLWLSHDFKQRHPDSVVVNQSVVLEVMKASGRVLHYKFYISYLLYLNSLDSEASLLIEAIEEQKLSSFHYRIVLLSYLVALRKIRIIVMFPIEFDPRIDIASQSERSLDCQVQAVLI